MEAILASFLLLTAVLMSASIFDSSLQVEAGNEKRVVASLVAENALAEIRQAANLNFNDLVSLYDGKTWSYPEFVGFQVTSSIREAELAVPCTVLETQYNRDAEFPAPTGRYIKGSAKRAEVRITWDDSGGQEVTIVENIASYGHANDLTLQLLLANGSVASDSTVVTVASGEYANFSVRALSGGQALADVQFSWYVHALTGHGSIDTVSRDGTECIYRNAYRNYDDKIKYAPGLCELVVQATFQGREAKATVRIKND